MSAIVFALMSAIVLPVGAAAAPMSLADYLALSGPAPQVSFRYGSAPSQYTELFLPAGAGPFPVALLVHGGCWTSKFGGLTQLRNMAGALAARGIAVWNVEYGRVDEEGGGYPGTYQDLNAALDQLAVQAPRHRLDLGRVVAVGHSAGGQLVQWLAGRARIAPGSPLHQAQPLPVRAVVSLGGLADLMPNGSHTVLVTGELDTISPPRVAWQYAARAQAAGDSAQVVILPGASHYDEVAASSPAWPQVSAAIEAALQAASRPR